MADDAEGQLRETKSGEEELLKVTQLQEQYIPYVVGQQKHDHNATAKGSGLKIDDDYELVDFIEKEIIGDKTSLCRSRVNKESLRTLSCNDLL